MLGGLCKVALRALFTVMNYEKVENVGGGGGGEGGFLFLLPGSAVLNRPYLNGVQRYSEGLRQRDWLILIVVRRGGDG